mmetsp:Transcript_7935/g.29297  ORF Transcript_7935/g.29297 Transcript_7935/m.29297 type:complete len:225 (-) Transcript_7935:7-681(-)
MTYIGASALGAVITTRFAPASMCFCAPARDVNTPVDSMTTSTPRSPQGMFDGSRSAYVSTTEPFTMNANAHSSPLHSISARSASDVPAKIPCTVSYLNMYAMYLASTKGSFTATTRRFGCFSAARMTNRPMRPKPLIPIVIVGEAPSSSEKALEPPRFCPAGVCAPDADARTIARCDRARDGEDILTCVDGVIKDGVVSLWCEMACMAAMWRACVRCCVSVKIF